MRAVRNTDQGIRVAEADEPEVPGVRLAVASTGICGTDVNFAAGGVQGYTYGHEFAGTAADGRCYAVEPTIYCGNCDQCRAGHVQRCNRPQGRNGFHWTVGDVVSGDRRGAGAGVTGDEARQFTVVGGLATVLVGESLPCQGGSDLCPDVVVEGVFHFWPSLVLCSR